MSTTPKLAHVVFQTGQLAEMRDWYCSVLDAHVVFENPGICFITYDEEHHRIALTQPPMEMVRKTPVTACAHHTAFTFDRIDDLLERYVELRDKGITPAVCIAHGVTTSLYYQDPDGNFVEMQIDNFAEPADATEYMHGPEYTEDAIGPAFDPEQLLTDHRGGAPIEEVTSRAWAIRAGLPNPLPILAGAGAPV